MAHPRKAEALEAINAHLRDVGPRDQVFGCLKIEFPERIRHLRKNLVDVTQNVAVQLAKYSTSYDVVTL